MQEKAKTMKRKIAMWTLVVFLALPLPLFAQGFQHDTNRFTYGFQRLLLAPFQIPYRVLEGTFYGPPITGTLGGVLQGTFSTVSDLVGGLFDMAGAAAPYAKYAIFFI